MSCNGQGCRKGAGLRGRAARRGRGSSAAGGGGGYGVQAVVCCPGLGMIQLYTETGYLHHHTRRRGEGLPQPRRDGPRLAILGSPWPPRWRRQPQGRDSSHPKSLSRRPRRARSVGASTSSPRRLLAPECDVQRLHVSFHVGRCWREESMRCFVDTGPSERGGMPRGGRLEACKHQGASSRELCPRHGPPCRLAIEDGSAPISSSRLRSHTLPPGQPHIKSTRSSIDHIWRLGGSRGSRGGRRRRRDARSCQRFRSHLRFRSGRPYY